MEAHKRHQTLIEKTAKAYGIDLDLLEMQLELTPMQRIDAHQKAFELVQTLQQAGTHAGTHGRHQQTPPSAHSK